MRTMNSTGCEGVGRVHEGRKAVGYLALVT